MAPTKMDGDWHLGGLPAGFVIVLFMMAEIEGFVTGTLDLSNGINATYGVEGNNSFPDVTLNFKTSAGTDFNFNFTGAFITTPGADGASKVVGVLSGHFNGPATLTLVS